MIPHILHRVWLGPKPPDDTWLDGWRRACPGWEIRTWTDRDLEGIDVPYVKEAYAAKKWAFVADYLRLVALEREGGFYLDTDVELASSFDPYCGDSFVVGLVKSGLPQTAVIGAEKGSSVVKEILATYEGARFDSGYGVYDERPINLRFKSVLARHGASLTPADAEREQSLPGGVRILPRSLVCIRTEGKPSVAWHHAAGTWQDGYKRKRVRRFTALGFGTVLLKRRKEAGDDFSAQLLADERALGSFRLRRFVFVFVRLAKRVSFGKALENAVHGVRCAIGRFLCRRVWTRVEPKKVVVNQFQGGGFGCNPKPVVEELLKRGGYDIVWLVRKGVAADLPRGVRTVRFGSWASLKELATAGTWLANHNLGRYVRHLGLVKKPGQRYLQTWHGSFGIKRCTEVLGPEETMMLDVFVANSAWEAELARGWFGPFARIVTAGHPRNDVIVASRGRDAAGAKTLLYVPTFRDDGALDAYLTDFTAVAAAFAARWPGEWKVEVRLHPNLRKKGVKLSFAGAVEDVTDAPDIQKLLAGADAVVSDYSSCIFDFALSGRPAFVYAPDRAKYETDRGFYYPLSATPFPVAESVEALVGAVVGFDEAAYAERLAAFFAEKGSAEDGRAAARVADLISRA